MVILKNNIVKADVPIGREECQMWTSDIHISINPHPALRKQVSFALGGLPMFTHMMESH
jgi:hypothetical protein